MAEVSVPLRAGFNTIDLDGAEHALDIDYLQLDGEALRTVRNPAGDTGTTHAESPAHAQGSAK